jgi:hypothetical protein
VPGRPLRYARPFTETLLPATSPPRRTSGWRGVLLLVLNGLFMTTLDASIVNIGLETRQPDHGLESADLTIPPSRKSRGSLARFPRILASLSHYCPVESGAYAWHGACLPSEEEDAVLSCDYNGWNDAPEDEREALDAYEAAAEKTKVAVGSGACLPAGGSIPTEGT